MKKAPVPENEKERIKDLLDLNILDTPREERFDFVTRLASVIFEVPITTIALVSEEEVWFKSIQGISIEKMQRDMSFCGHALLEEEKLIVNDATKDERFWDNPTVINEPHVKFYAGIPLFSPKGRPVGTFCIIDQKERHLDEKQVELLKGFARWAETEINIYNIGETLNYIKQVEEERERIRGELKEQADYLQSIVTSIGDGVITTDKENKVVSLNVVAEELTGWSREEAEGQDVKIVFNTIRDEDILEKKDGESVVLVSRQGRRSRITESSAPIINEEGENKGTVLVFRDVSEEQRKERRIAESERRLREAHIIAKMGRWDYYHQEKKLVCSENVFRILETDKKEEWSRDGFLEFVHVEDRESLRREMERAVEEGRGYKKEYRIVAGNKVKWVSETSETSYDDNNKPLHTVGVIQEVTKKKEAEKTMLQNEKQLELFFSNSLYGFFIVKTEQPVEWHDGTDKESALDYILAHQKITKVNQTLLEQHGIEEEEQDNLRLEDIFFGKKELLRSVWRDVLNKGKGEGKMEKGEGDEKKLFIEGNYTCIYNEEGKVTGFFGVHFDITEKKKKEEQEQFAFVLQKIAVGHSSQLIINKSEDEQDDVFNNILRELGDLFNADRSYLFFFQENLSLMTNTHEWCREGVESQKEDIVNFVTENLPWWKGEISKKEPVFIGNIEQLGEEAAKEREEFLRQGIKSLLCLPMISGRGELLGFMGLDFNTSKDQFPEMYVAVLQVVANDIAAAIERNRIMKGLGESEEKFRQIMENMEDVVWLRSKDNKEMLYINPAYERLWGRERGYIYENPEDFIESIVVEDREVVYKELERYMKEGVFNLEYRISRPDGLQKWVHARSYPVYGSEGEVIRHVGIATDITPKKEAMSQIKKSEEKYKNLVERVRQEYFFYSYNKQGDITYTSPSIKDVTGYEQQELENIHRLPFTNNPVNQKLKSCTEKSCSGEESVTYEVEIFSKNGRILILRLLENPIFDVFGNISGVEGLAKDITKERQIEKTRTEFVSLVSHQLKTPLGSMAWDLEMLLSGDYGELKKEQKKIISEAHSMNRRMIELVNGLLNVSRIEMGKVAVDLEEISLVESAEEILRELKGKIFLKKQKVIRNYEVDVPNIRGDERLIKIIWENIISNAVKYGHREGKIEVGVKKEEGSIVAFVKNEGKGIPRDEQARVFQRMFRASNAESLDPSGNGLGLYLVKSIIDTTGGKIWFESEEEGETTFFFSFPLEGMTKQEDRIDL